MSKSYSQSSLGRDFMNVGSGSKFGPQGSRGMFSGPSSKNLPSIFSLGNRGPPPPPPPPPPMHSQHRGDSNQATKILASFGLSSRDLDELSRFPEEKITPESLPQLIQQIKRRRSEEMSMLSYRERLPQEPLRVSSSEWDDDIRPYRRESFDRAPVLDHVVDYDHGSRSREPAYRERLDFDDRLRDRERFREDRYMPDTSIRKLGSDYEPMRYNQPQERSGFEKARGIPSIRNVDDFHGLIPKEFPHLCSLCDLPINTKKGWYDHTNGPNHKRQRMLLLEVYPDWNGHGMGDHLMLQQSTNHAPGLLGPPPPPAPQSLLHMGGGPEGRHGGHGGHGGPGHGGHGGHGGPGHGGHGGHGGPGHGGHGGHGGPGHGGHGGPRGHSGMEERGPGPRHFQSRPGTGRVVHIINFERGKNLKKQLLNIAAPFGQITNHLILNKMNEAFIEMSSTSEAMSVVDYYSTNQALIQGKPVRVHLSQKYKRIKKEETKPEAKPEPKKQDPGKVVHISKLPSYGYTDAQLLKLAENFGKVKTYILMRVRNQAFIEMERLEDAKEMVKRSATTPLVFQGKTVKVDLSERYKKLVLRIPNKLIEQKEQKEKNRKRAHSPDRKSAVKEKQPKSTEESESADGGVQATTDDDVVHTSEEADQKDLVSDSCEPELLEEEGMEEEATALLESGSSVADDEVLDADQMEDGETEEYQTEAQEPNSTDNSFTEERQKEHPKYSGNIDEFVTLDEVGDEEESKASALQHPEGDAGKAEYSSVMASTSVEETEQENEAQPEEAAEKETCDAPPESQPESTQDTENTAETSSGMEIPDEYVLGPYQPNNPVGVDYVVPKTGFYCKLCCLFYTNEDVAKVTHCSTLPHYQKLKKLLNKMTKNPEKQN
ncbi:matrin-3 isoform X2 [Engystomops pustulosus]|uniref:matrin-3 isoform X2 n=1 Tax=Engystomops pustulosus TaxID=76066 RepID=UPI003AFAE2D9